MRYEVRCCCNPQKLLGWLHAPDRATSARFPLRISMARYAYIELPIQLIYEGHNTRPAIKAEGMTLEDLRNVVGFEEA